MEKISGYSKWTLRAAIIFSLVFTLKSNHWVGTMGGTIIIAATFVVDYINHKIFKINAAITSMVYIYCIFSLVLGNMWDFYDIIEWWDIVMHILSGIILGVIGDVILNSQMDVRKSSALVRFLFIVGIACLGGVIWEIYEFTIDSSLNLDTQLARDSGVTDTMLDLITDFLGGAGTGLFLLRNKKN